MTSVSEDLPEPETEELPCHPPRRGWGCAQWFLVGVLAFLAAAFGVSWVLKVNEQANEMWAMSYCRQILVPLKAYAGEHGGRYPEGATANDAFRKLFLAGYFKDETVFGCPNSPYLGDNNVGNAPEYAQALQARENHWAMTKGLADDSPGNSPLLFENPALASWPPRWDSRLIDVPKPGRIWKGGRIVIGRNDGSVQSERLSKSERPLVTLEPNSDGKNLFELAGPHEVLDVAR